MEYIRGIKGFNEMNKRLLMLYPHGIGDCILLTPVLRKLHADKKFDKSTQSSEEATLYVTLSPCFECAKLIHQAGIRRVVYKERYSDTTGLELLKLLGVRVGTCTYPGGGVI